MGIPIDIDSLRVRETRPDIGIGGVQMRRRNSSYTAGNNLVSSRGTMNGLLTLRRAESREMNHGGEMMNSGSVEGSLVVWDKEGSQIAVVSREAGVSMYNIAGGISPGNELSRVAQISRNEYLFMGHSDAIYFATGEGDGDEDEDEDEEGDGDGDGDVRVHFQSWNVGPITAMWYMPHQSKFCCILPDGTAHVSEDPRVSLRRRISIHDDTLECRQMTHYIQDYALLDVSPTGDSLAIAKHSGEISILKDGFLRYVTGFGLTEEEAAYRADPDEKVTKMLWSDDSRFLCIVTTQRILVYDNDMDAITVVAGEHPNQHISWGGNGTILFLLSTHLYGTMLKCFEHNSDEQQWICCGFEDVRSQFSVHKVHAFHVCAERQALTIYHDQGRIDTFEYRITQA